MRLPSTLQVARNAFHASARLSSRQPGRSAKRAGTKYAYFVHKGTRGGSSELAAGAVSSLRGSSGPPVTSATSRIGSVVVQRPEAAGASALAFALPAIITQAIAR